MKFLSIEKLSPHRYKTPEGYLICTDAIIARTGKQQYKKNELFTDSEDDETMIDVDRPTEEVFSEQTIASGENKPLVDEHPEEDVTVENHRDLSMGYMRDLHRGIDNGKDVLMANIVVTDPTVISEIESGDKTELSCGYDCQILKDSQGNYYQSKIRINHLALCERGRAGNARIQDSVNDEEKLTFKITWVGEGLKGNQTTILMANTEKEAKEKFEKMYSNMKNNKSIKKIEQIQDSVKDGRTLNKNELLTFAKAFINCSSEEELLNIIKEIITYTNNKELRNKLYDIYDMDGSVPYRAKKLSDYMMYISKMNFDSVQDSVKDEKIKEFEYLGVKYWFDTKDELWHSSKGEVYSGKLEPGDIKIKVDRYYNFYDSKVQDNSFEKNKIKDDYSSFLGNYGFDYLKGSGDYEYWYLKYNDEDFDKLVKRIRQEYPMLIISSSPERKTIYIQKSKYKKDSIKDANSDIVIRYKEQGSNAWTENTFKDLNDFRSYLFALGIGTYYAWIMWVKKNGERIFLGPKRFSEIEKELESSLKDSIKDSKTINYKGFKIEELEGYQSPQYNVYDKHGWNMNSHLSTSSDLKQIKKEIDLGYLDDYVEDSVKDSKEEKISKVHKVLTIFKKVKDYEPRYVIYAKGTWNNYTALFYRHNAPAKYSTEAQAEKFTEAEANRIINYTKGNHIWLKKEV